MNARLLKIKHQAGAMNTGKWLMIRMDMLRRLIGPWGKGASKEQQQVWRREYDDLEARQNELARVFVEDRASDLEH
jgi:hypothetical protein